LSIRRFLIYRDLAQARGCQRFHTLRIQSLPLAKGGVNRYALAALLVLALVPAVGRAETGQDAGQERNKVTGVVPDADFRLSGIVAVNGEARLAVVELAGQGGHMVRVGDVILGGARVLAMGPDWVRLEQQGEERILRLRSLPAGVVPQATAQPAPKAEPAPQGGGQTPHLVAAEAEGELQEIIRGVAANPKATADDLGSAIGAYLGLPANTEIAVTDVSFGVFDSAAAAKAALDQKGMVRVQVGGADGPQQMIYLQAPPPEGSQGAAEQP
jgi:hypothetical protein